MASRLLVVSDTLAGGEGALAAFHAAVARRHGWEVALAAPAGEADAVPADEHDPVPVPRTVRDVAGMRRAAAALRDVLERRAPDVVHCHGARCFAATRLAGARRPFVSLHGVQPVSGDPPGYRWLRRTGLAVVPRLSAGATDDGPNDLPGWRFRPHASPALEHLRPLGPPTGDRPTFVWLGRLDEPKQPEVFVRAMAALARERPDARGLVAGSGPLAGALTSLARSLGAPVELLGHQSAVGDVLAGAWAVTLFSRAEGVPLSLEEAMWAGRAVVATPLPGIRFLAGERGGILATEPEEVAAALHTLCDPATAALMGAEAAEEVRRLVRPEDPWPSLVEQYRAHLAGEDAVPWRR